MRTDWSHLEEFRKNNQRHASKEGDTSGLFVIPFDGRHQLFVIATSGNEDLGEVGKWEHVSVHGEQKQNGRWRLFTPTWEQMDFIKKKFWKDTETVVQFHAPAGDLINCHTNTLHLWRQRKCDPARPPAFCK